MVKLTLNFNSSDVSVAEADENGLHICQVVFQWNSYQSFAYANQIWKYHIGDLSLSLFDYYYY